MHMTQPGSDGNADVGHVIVMLDDAADVAVAAAVTIVVGVVIIVVEYVLYLSTQVKKSKFGRTDLASQVRVLLLCHVLKCG